MKFSKGVIAVVQGIFLCVLFLCTVAVMRENEPQILAMANLVFHEAGHPLFGILFGSVMGAFGGTLMQLLIPLVCAAYFVRRFEWFSVWVLVWWFGENMIGIAKYISDARAMALPLLGGQGVGHDWNFLLSFFGLLEWDTVIGGVVRFFGFSIMMISLFGMGWAAMKAYQKERQEKERFPRFAPSE